MNKACLSEDMDMFVYGCPRVIRYLSLLNHTAVIYDMKGILENLGITQKELREICVLSGTDYNSLNDESKNSPTIYTTLNYFKKFHKGKNNIEFYDWLIENTDYIKDNEILNNIYNILLHLPLQGRQSLQPNSQVLVSILAISRF